MISHIVRVYLRTENVPSEHFSIAFCSTDIWLHILSVMLYLLLPPPRPYRSPTSGEVTGLEGRLALEDTNYRNTPKLTWLAVGALPEGEHTPTTLLHFDVLIKKPVLKPDDNWKEYVNYDSKACWVHIYWCSA